MNLSRAAKKFQNQASKGPEAPRPVFVRKPAPEPVKAPIVEKVEPVAVTIEPEVEAAVPTPAPEARPQKGQPVKPKRARFVREKGERRERVSLPPLPTASTKFTAKLMTRNLAVPPKDDGRSGR